MVKVIVALTDQSGPVSTQTDQSLNSVALTDQSGPVSTQTDQSLNSLGD